MQFIIAPTNKDLYHHGILGQKWGRRNGPPYPLGSSAHSSAEKKAGWQKSLKSGSKPSGTGRGSSGIDTHAKSPDKEKSGSAVLAYLAVYAGITALSLAPLALAAAAESAKRGMSKLKEHREDKLRTKLQKDEKTGLPLKKKEMTPKQDIKHINPGFKNGDKDTTMNCPFCVTAYELRRRGFDVRAGKTEKGRYDEDIEKFYKEKKKFQYAELPGIDKEHAPTNKDIARTMNETLSKQGGRGTVKVIWKYGGAHVFNYDTTIDGKVHYYDGQNGKEYNIERDVAPHLYTRSVETEGGKRGKGCWAYLRTDNLTPDYEFLKKEKVVV